MRGTVDELCPTEPNGPPCPAWQLRREDLPEVLPKIHEESLFLIEERGITFEFTDTSNEREREQVSSRNKRRRGTGNLPCRLLSTRLSRS